MKWAWPLVWESESGRWWRFIITYVLLRAIFFALGAFSVFALQDFGIQKAIDDCSTPIKAGAQMALMAIPLCFSGVGCLLGIRFVHGKPIRCVFTDGRPFGFGLALRSAVVWLALWCLGVAFTPEGWSEVSRRYAEIPPTYWPGVCVILLFVITLQAATEEICDRGYLQNQVGAWLKHPWLAVCVSTFVFAALHNSQMSPAAWLRIIFMGLVLGAATVRSGTLAAAISVHAVNNTLGVLWLPHRTNANTTWIEGVIRVGELLVWFAWLMWATRPKRAIQP